MDFGLSDEQLLLQQSARELHARECSPAVVRRVFESGAGHAPELWKRSCQLGLGGLLIPERWGGAGLELLDAALFAEVLGESAAPGPFLGHSLAGLAISLAGSDAQCKRWLGPLAAGELIGTVALEEASGGIAPAAARTRIERGRASGVLCRVPAGELADVIVVAAKGDRLAVVERGAGALSAEESADRTRLLANLRLDRSPCEPLARAKGVAARVRDAARVLLAADAFGGSQRLVEMSVAYARTREQFGQSIAQFQAVKHDLADLALRTETSRGLFWYAAHAWDAIPHEAERLAALAKAHLTDRYLETARKAVELHGGIGFTWECDVHLWYRRALLNRVLFGTPTGLRENCAQLAGW